MTDYKYIFCIILYNVSPLCVCVSLSSLPNSVGSYHGALLVYGQRGTGTKKKRRWLSEERILLQCLPIAASRARLVALLQYVIMFMFRQH